MGHTAEANGTAAAAPAAVVARWLSLLIEPGGVTELRAIEHRPRQDDGWTETVAGFFDVAHLPDMAARALQLDRKSEGVYFPLNPLVPEILARRMNRAAPVKEKKPITAADKDVTRRRWLLIDVDPSRLSGVSSTDAEKAVAQERIELIRSSLGEAGWPAPILADSGNGYHLLYRIDLPAEDGGTVQRCLQALAARFDQPGAKID